MAPAGVRITEETSRSEILVVICCILPDQIEEVDEAYFKQFQEVSVSLTVAQMGKFSLSDQSAGRAKTVNASSHKDFWRVSESQNHTKAEAGRDLSGSSGPLYLA